MRSNKVRYWAALCALGFACALALAQSASERPRPEAWKTVDELVKEQKLEAAAVKAAELREAAHARGDAEDWARGLITEMKLRGALHGYETAVRFLKEQPWPEAPLARTELDLYYAHSLTSYAQAYSWEIRERERVESKVAVDLKSWTSDQIYAEAQRAFNDVWRRRQALGAIPVRGLSEVLEPGNYPPGIRDTLRDAASYLYVELLADTASWRPEQVNGVYQLDLASLLRGDPASASMKLDDPAVHPLVRIAAILGDLEAWHQGAGRREAALEARLQLFIRLHAAFTNPGDRKRIAAELARRLDGYKGLPWWSQGMAVLADFVQAEDEPDNLVRAHAIAGQGQRAFPESVGGQRCLSIVRAIEAPQFHVEAMTHDASGKRSIDVTHKNVATLYFRAYDVDLEQRFANGEEALTAIIQTRAPLESWSVQLAPTPDFKSHRTPVTPPLKKVGSYLVVASYREDFQNSDNQIAGTDLIIGDLVLLSRDDGQGGVMVTAVSGETGGPQAGVDVRLYDYHRTSGYHLVGRFISDAAGEVHFPYTHERGWQSFFARRGADLALDESVFTLHRPDKPPEARSAFIYTDRSIYRPLQKVLWKVLVFRGKEDRYKVEVGARLTVSLRDPNGETVASTQVAANEFGTAAGEFAIPSGRVLGSWTIITSARGEARIRVEEYKRPTFEATIQDPKLPLRLNRPAALTGEARYYFGLPVTSGTVKWQVQREPVYPWWWRDWGWRRPIQGEGTAQTVAAGTAALGPDGTFKIAFTPAADERQGKSAEVSYRYTLHADVTDEGGETRSADRSFRLGTVAVEARLDFGVDFLTEGAAAQASVSRSDLDGVPRAGKGSWRLIRLAQPDRVVLPADEPLPAADEGGFHTPGDGLRRRWGEGYGDYVPAASLHAWRDGDAVARGELAHDDNGKAAIQLPALKAGAYRIRYETFDPFGAKFELAREIVVAGPKPSLNLPALLLAQESSVKVGGTARLLVHSGIAGEMLLVDIARPNGAVERRRITAGRDPSLLQIPVGERDRGGFSVMLTAVRDHQLMRLTQKVLVPWDNKELRLEFATFRDTLQPGAKETWRVTVKSPAGRAEAGSAEVLAYMFDRSLDLFGPHVPPSIAGLYGGRTGKFALATSSLGGRQAQWMYVSDIAHIPSSPHFSGERLKEISGYGIGGPGRGYFSKQSVARGLSLAPESLSNADRRGPAAPEAAVPLRANFAETAFWKPQLLTGKDGSAILEFQVPDSVTAWNVWVHAVTRDLRGGSLRQEARSVKNLMVRPYLPRFLREGDVAELKVIVNNAGERDLEGSVSFDVTEVESGNSAAADFGLASGTRPFQAAKGGSASVSYKVVAPRRVGTYAIRAVARAGDLSDGELRPVPVLPSRMHLAQSRFVALRDKDRRDMTFADLARGDDPTRLNEQLVVTLDAQLFYTVLQALPYLVNYPYECTEQTLNRFVSTGIVASVFKDYPAVAKMAQAMSKRKTPLETWDTADPNRKMVLEETPWLVEAQGGRDAGLGVVNVLDPRVARAERDASLRKLRKAQTASGGFPWFPGGPPSPWMTLYLLAGFAKAAEFGVQVPEDMIRRGWAYLSSHLEQEYTGRMLKDDCCWEFLTFVNYVASSYRDPSWTGLAENKRKQILAFSFRHWKQHSPYLKGMLAMTLKRMGRARDAELVWASVMDSAKTTKDEGTFWAPEDRAWLWYNDTIETHAYALRTLVEVTPGDARRHGLVQWILMNKKLNHWKSTRATAEVIYSLIHYLKREGALGVREDATVVINGEPTRFTFAPDVYTGKANQVLVPGNRVSAGTATVEVSKESKGFLFASATWQFSSDRLPSEDRGDLLAVSRRYFRRESNGREFMLTPLAEGGAVRAGDQIEVQLSLRAKHPSEYVHLRDPRAAGLEPEGLVSGFKWDLGIGWYEEIRDSGTNFFFEQLPQGEYTFKYRLRANLAGTFRIGPATVQSMYAPEFTAYSAGAVLEVKGGG